MTLKRYRKGGKNKIIKITKIILFLFGLDNKKNKSGTEAKILAKNDKTKTLLPLVPLMSAIRWRTKTPPPRRLITRQSDHPSREAEAP